MSKSRLTTLEKIELLHAFEKSSLSVKAFTKQHHVDSRSLKMWQQAYQRDGIKGLERAAKNKHYSEAFKLEVVLAYLNGEGSQRQLVKRFEIKSTTQIYEWVLKYNRDKELTASPSRKLVPKMSRKVTFEERIEAVEYVTKFKHSYSEAAEHFQVSYQQVRSWVKKTEQGGYQALVDNRGHRKPEKELSELELANLRIRELEAQVKEKDLMAAFIKKFQEIQHRE